MHLGGGASLLYICVAYYMPNEGGWVQIECNVACVLNGRPLLMISFGKCKMVSLCWYKKCNAKGLTIMLGITTATYKYFRGKECMKQTCTNIITSKRHHCFKLTPTNTHISPRHNRGSPISTCTVTIVVVTQTREAYIYAKGTGS